jgi:hypothetical protein
MNYTIAHIRVLLPFSSHTSHLFSSLPLPSSLPPLLAPSIYLPKHLSLSKQLLYPQYLLLIDNIMKGFLADLHNILYIM